jgi:acetylornithine deacetylase/succinyl-diaminopimelate desuccinylase-like protein
VSELDNVLRRIDDDLDAALDRLFALLRIRSISTDPAYAAECRACADWHVADLQGIGFDATARSTPGHPIVVGHDRSTAGPSALFYGHYDVQPVDPLELWDRDPPGPCVVCSQNHTLDRVRSEMHIPAAPKPPGAASRP